MKVLIVGGSGMLGHKLFQAWRDKFDLRVTVRTEFADYERYKIFNRANTIGGVDVENIASVEKAVYTLKPDVIVNAVGIIKQLSSAKSVIKTLTVNSIFPHQLSEISARIGSRLITISTDCVFSGSKGNYNESDISDALDLYGKSKFLGEITDGDCLTIRTSIVGRELNSSHGLIEWFLSEKGKSVKGFTKAFFSGFPTVVLADILADLIENHSELNGLFHVSSEPINKYDLLRLVNDEYRAGVEIEPFDDFEIDRTLDSTKFKEATGFTTAGWREMVERMAEDDTLYQNR